MDIKNLFSEEDFNLLNDALENLPHKEVGVNMAMDLIDIMLPFDTKQQREIKRKEREAKLKKEKEAITENIRVLQGKLIQLKRFLATEGALKSTNDIINPLQAQEK